MTTAAVFLASAFTLAAGAGADRPEAAMLAVAADGRIQVLRSDGGLRRNVTGASHKGFRPRWVDGGRLVTFRSSPQGVGTILMRADGAYPRLVSSSAAVVSPDGRRIAEFREDGEIVVTRLAERAKRLIRFRIRSGEWLYDVDGTYPRWSPDGTRLLFSVWAEDEVHSRVVVVDVASGTSRTISRESSPRDSDPEWSPDGRHVAFLRDYEDLWVMRADGSARTRLLTGVDGDYAWSPDAARIAARRGGTLVVVDVATRASQVVVRRPVEDWISFAWSPNGRTLAVTDARGLATVLVRGGAPRPLVRGAVYDVQWAPGRRILARVGGDIATVDAGTGRVRRLARAFDDRAPAWSPNGKEIAFARQSSEGTHVHAVRIEGSSLRRVGRGTSPSWSPDGRTIRFVRGGRIFRVPSRGGRALHIADGLEPAWSPDGSRVAFLRHRYGKFDPPGPADRAPLRVNSVLLVARADGSTVRVLRDGAEHWVGEVVAQEIYERPQWSPDGRTLGVWTENLDHGEGTLAEKLLLVDASSRKARVLDVPGHALGERMTWAWAPNGSRIAAASKGAVVVFGTLRGTVQRKFVLGKSWSEPQLAFAPDGRRLLAANADPPRLLLLNIGTGTARDLGPGADPAWRPSDG